MKKTAIMLSATALFLASCVGNPDGKKAETTDALEVASLVDNELAVVPSESKINWEGRKVTGKHHGEVSIKSGTLHVDGEGKLISGNFIADLTSIDVQDLEGEYKEKLTNHLKSDDFFDVDNHPDALFEITSVTPGEADNQIVVSGNLTIRGTSKNISFDAEVKESSATHFAAVADFNIEREEWGVSYPGQADDLISKEINLKIELVASSTTI